MPYRFLEKMATSDVAFEATGASPEELFNSAAEALTNVMVEDLSTIERKEEIEFSVKNPEIDLLLFDFLNELIYYKDTKKLLLRVEMATLGRSGLDLFLRVKAYGETIDPKKHPLKVDVKAVTLHNFRAEETEKGWEATVVLDV